MKKLLLAASLSGICVMASAQDAPTREQATQALQNAMQREIQGMQSAPSGAKGNFDSQGASDVVRTLQVKSIDNCQAAGAQTVACQVRTSAQVKGSVRESVHQYHFYQQGGKWEARLPSAS